MTTWRGRGSPGWRQLGTGSSGGSCLLLRRSSEWGHRYEFVGALGAHVVNGDGVDGDEDYAHEVEVHGAPVVLQDHVRVPADESNNE